MRSADRMKVYVLEIKCLRSLVGLSVCHEWIELGMKRCVEELE